MVLIAKLDTLFERAADMIGGMPVDQIRLALTLISVVPLGFLFQFVRQPAARYAIGSVLGVLLQYIVYRDLVLWPVMQTVVAYALTVVFKEKAGNVMFIENLLFVSTFHIYRQITAYGEWNIDITTVLMMSTPKYVSFAYNVQDGIAYKKQTDAQPDKRLTEDQALRRLDRIPSFFEYFSYVHFFGGSVCGPSFEFYDYKLFINRAGDFAAVPLLACARETARLFARTAVFMAGVVFLMPRYPIQLHGDPIFAEFGWVYQTFYFCASITLIRVRYYAGFTLAELGLCSTGLMYNGRDAKTGAYRWDRTRSCDPEGVELTHDLRQKIECWNISIQTWLKRYVHARLFTEKELKQSRTKQSIAQYYTLLISSLWHGFYPGYYNSFFHWSMCLSIAKFFYRWNVNYPRLFEKLEKQLTPRVYKALRFLIVNIAFNYFGIPFQILSLQAGWNFFVSTNFSWVIILYAAAFFSLTGFGQKPPKAAPNKDGASDAKAVSDVKAAKAGAK